ncbi:MAG: hypothetical protein AAF491_00015 [Verrucomicrobiota bacterium]
MHQAHELLQTWKDGTLVLPDEPNGASDAFSRHLSKLYGLPLEACHLVSNAVTNAAVGSRVCLMGPGTVSTAPALNTLLISEGGTRLQLAIEDAFQALRPHALRMAIAKQTLTGKSVDGVKQQAADLLAKSDKALSSAAKTRSSDDQSLQPSEFNWFDPNWATTVSGGGSQKEKAEQEARNLEQEAATLKAEATKVISAYHFHDKPGFLVQGPLPEELVETHDLCADGTIFNLDVDANTWMSLARLSPAKSRIVGSRFNAAWRASTVARKGEILPASTISSLSRMSSDDFMGFWTNPRIEENRLKSIILPAYTNFAGSFHKEECHETDQILQFYESSVKLLFQRIKGKPPETIVLSREAHEVFLSFVGDIEDASSSHPGIRDLLKSAGSSALRQSLLLHLGNEGAKALTGETMKRACHLTAWCVCGTAQMLETQRRQRQNRPSDFDEEVWVIVGKVRKKGPLSRRELYRTFHDQASSRHQPIIEKALSRGLLRETEDGCLFVPDDCET